VSTVSDMLENVVCVVFVLGEPFINMTAHNVTVNEGATALLSVNVHSYPTEPELTWFKDGQLFTTRSHGQR